MNAQYGRTPNTVESAGAASQHDYARMRSALEIAGSLPAGVIIVNKSARFLWQNKLADRILGTNPILHIHDGILAAQGYTAELHALIKAAARDPKSPCVMSIARPHAFPLCLLVLPTLWPDPETRSDGKALAIIISDPALPQTPNRMVLRRLYGFTQTEAALAAYLMTGQALTTVAEMMQISTSTARSHLKKLFQKTGTARQTELVRLLLSGPALLCADAVEPSTEGRFRRGAMRAESTNGRASNV